MDRELFHNPTKVTNVNGWQRTLKLVEDMQVNGFLRQQGSYREIEYSEIATVNSYYIGGANRMEGAHICYLVRRDVQKRIASGEYVVDSDPETFHKKVNHASLFTMWNDRGIERAIKRTKGEIKAVDINYCYWNTIRNIGAISEHTYNLGLKKKSEWKDSRNASIGSLNKRDKITPIIGGRLDEKNSYYTDAPLAGVRLDVLYEVYKVAMEVIRRCGDDFAFFFTDCFFVLPSAVDKVQKILASHKYESKVKTDRIYRMTPRGEGNAMIEWRENSEGDYAKNYMNKRNHVDNQK